MTTHTKGRRELDLARFPIFATLNDALGLFNRFREGETFRHYIEERLRLVVPICCLMLFISVASGAATMMFLGQVHHALVLLGVLVLPVILVGSLFVQAYTFFTWLENRAVVHRTHPGTRLGLGPLPAVPWGLTGAVLFAPLGLLFFVAWQAAIVVFALALLAPFAYASLDR